MAFKIPDIREFELRVREHIKRNIIMNTRVRTEFYRTLELEMAGRSDLVLAIDEFARSIRGGLFGSKRRQAFLKIHFAVSDGVDLDEACEEFMPPDELLFLRSIWFSDKQAEGFQKLADTTKYKVDSGAKMLAEFMPSFLILALNLGTFYYIGTQAVQNARLNLHPGEQLPALAAFTVWMAHQNPGFLIFLASIPLQIAILVIWSLPNWVGPMRIKFDRFGPWKTYRKQSGVQLLSALAEMGKANISIPDALQALEKSSVPWLKNVINVARLKYGDGEALGKALSLTGTFVPDEDVCTRITQIESTTDFAERLLRTILTYKKDVDREVQKKRTAIAGLLMIFSLSLSTLLFPINVQLMQHTNAGIRYNMD